ncbi:hypothetical protein FNB79_11760 [Formosa sediminum]|uniref:Outer membrane lipoprotein-sorting protein n=1 Tax=Formosa sediminum TaxID=2594004 RepID=A0A516GSW0_9FLAO|nr:hypothetical protein [Formosa sediminum]QDO94611.1 hypothetical protein FNB79_11760 [Formosa sediminum]
MKNIKTFIFILFGVLSLQAQDNQKKIDQLVQQSFEAMGGMENWNNTHFIQWDFGKRTLFWDKWTGNVRIENPNENLIVIVNINSGEGKASKDGTLITDTNTLNKVLEQGKKWWINDSYWLTMPWKLKDEGVQLKYLKTAQLPNGNVSDVLEMTFKDVGVTPNNKYHIYIDQKDHLVKQWAFFGNYTDDNPRFINAWDNYQKAGKVLLSFNRSENAGGPKNVVVKDQINSDLFNKI